MKILIVGDYGFLCSHLTERLEREGNEVYIVTAQKENHKNKPLCKHVAFECETTSNKVEHIFKSVTPEAVIFLGAFDEGFWSSRAKRSENEFLSALMNVLKYSVSFEVNKFIFLSSQEVYAAGTDESFKEQDEAIPATFRGNIFLEGEALCERWEKSYGLNCLSLRVPELYGPRQYETFEGAFIMRLIEKLLYEEPIKIHEGKVHPLLYIGDATDAIYRALGSTISKKMNISSEELLKEGEILEIVEEKLGKKAAYVEYVKEYNPSVILDSSRARKELDWVSLHDVRKGIEKTLQWVKENSQDIFQRLEQKEKPKKIKIDKSWERVYPYLENLVLFLLVAFFTNAFGNHPLFSLLDVTLLYIVSMAVIFGVKQASISVLLASALYVWGLIQNGSDLVGALLNFQTMLRIAEYFLISVAIGYALDRKKVEVVMKEEELNYVNSELQELEKIHQENLKIKEVLEHRLIGYGDSFGKIYSIVSKLDLLLPERIIPSAIDVLMEIMKSKHISIYSSSSHGNYLRLAASSTKRASSLGKSIRIDDLEEFGQAIKKQNIFTNTKLKENFPMMATGIYYEGNLIYAIFIWDVPFEVANLYYTNLLRTIAALISSSLNKAYKYLEATADNKHVVNTKILKPEVFEEIINAKEIAREMQLSEYSLLEICYDELEKTADDVSSIIRDTDYLGLDKEGRLLALLSNSNETDSDVVMKRFKEKKLECRVVAD